MKLLTGKQHTKSRNLLTDGNEIEVAEFPIIYDKNGWIVFADYSCEDCGITYMLQHGVAENVIICQTTEQIQIYIPDFKMPKDKGSKDEEEK